MAVARNGYASFLVLVLLIFIPGTLSICYYPDGSAAGQDTACSDETDESSCCGVGYACVMLGSQGICQSTGDEIQKTGASTYVRGSCTDSTWKSSYCPNFCVNAAYDDVAGGEGIGKCENTTAVLFYCIDDQPYNCTSEDNVLLFQSEPSILTTIGVAASTTSTISSSTTSSSISTTLAASTTPTTSTVSTSTAAATQPTGSGSQSTTIGAAVGGSLAGILLGAAGLWLLLRARKRKQADGAVTDVTGVNMAAVPPLHPELKPSTPGESMGPFRPPTELDPTSAYRNVYEAPEHHASGQGHQAQELPAWEFTGR